MGWFVTCQKCFAPSQTLKKIILKVLYRTYRVYIQCTKGVNKLKYCTIKSLERLVSYTFLSNKHLLVTAVKYIKLDG